MRSRIHTYAIVVALTSLYASAAFGQYRLNKFFAQYPILASTVLSDGASVFILQYNDTTLLQKCDPQGQALWAKNLDEPAPSMDLFENTDASITLYERYPAQLQISGDPGLDSATQRIRITRMDQAGNMSWSRSVSMHYLFPSEFPPTVVLVTSVPTSDGGVMTGVMASAFTSGPVAFHLLKHASDGSLLWCKLLGEEYFGLHMWGQVGLLSTPSLRLLPSDDGGAYLLDQTRFPGSAPHILRVSESGEPLQFIGYDYLGANPNPERPIMGIGAQGELLIADRAGTAPGGSHILYRFNPDLSLSDKDIYFGLDLQPMTDISSRSDGRTMLRFGSTWSGTLAPVWVDVDEAGEIQSAYRAPLIPYVDEQVLTLRSLATRFMDPGARMAYSQLITHPVLGNIGFFTGQTMLNTNGGSCYFEPANAQHIQVPDSLVSITTAVLPIAIPANCSSETSTPLSNAAPIPTLLGCDAQVDVQEHPTIGRFGIAPNPVRSGEPFWITVDEPQHLVLLDLSGETIHAGSLLRSSGTWTWPHGTLAPGVYALVGTSQATGRVSIVRLVVQ